MLQLNFLLLCYSFNVQKTEWKEFAYHPREDFMFIAQFDFEGIKILLRFFRWGSGKVSLQFSSEHFTLHSLKPSEYLVACHLWHLRKEEDTKHCECARLMLSSFSMWALHSNAHWSSPRVSSPVDIQYRHGHKASDERPQFFYVCFGKTACILIIHSTGYFHFLVSRSKTCMNNGWPWTKDESAGHYYEEWVTQY